MSLNSSRLPAALVLVGTALIVGCSSDEPAAKTGGEPASAPVNYVLQQSPELTMEVIVHSKGDDGRLDKNFTCEGRDDSPHVGWSGAPDGTKSLVLIMDDPSSDTANEEASGRAIEDVAILWTHWVLYSIPPSVTEIGTGEASVDTLPSGAKHGANDFGESRYSGPCPAPNIIFGDDLNFRTPLVAELRPYFFTVYALDKEIDLSPAASRSAVLEAIDGHILAAGQGTADYKSRRRVLGQRSTVSN